MDLETIISTIAGQADALLAGMTSMSEARPALRDYLKKKHPQLGVIETQRVIAGVFAILEEEGFFEASASGDTWDVGEAR